MPPALPGRESLIDTFSTAIERLKIGRHAKSLLPYGLRGVGKTVLLRRFITEARRAGYLTGVIEAEEEAEFLPALADQLRRILFTLDTGTKVHTLAKRALRVFKSFTVNAGLHGISMSLGVDAERGFGDSGDIATDLTALFLSIGEAAREQETAILIAVDEVQYLKEREFSALIKAIHQVTQETLPVLVVATGLPQVLALAGDAKSYAERLFDYRSIGPLSNDDAREALIAPAQNEGVVFEQDAANAVIEATRGYPFFLQEWAYAAWNEAPGPNITVADVRRGEAVAVPKLDDGFFAVRYNRCTPGEKRYLRGMAELGEGPYRTGDVAKTLNRENNKLGPTRDSLIKKGMIWSPEHGLIAFTVPLFDQFMRRKEPQLT
jgi:AAA ATPase domain